MITKRIIPCLDVRNGRVVKGTNFENLNDAFVKEYEKQEGWSNADFVTALDSASATAPATAEIAVVLFHLNLPRLLAPSPTLESAVERGL